MRRAAFHCPRCRRTEVTKGRAPDGRRAYRCESCYYVWTKGMQGKAPKWIGAWTWAKKATHAQEGQ